MDAARHWPLHSAASTEQAGNKQAACGVHGVAEQGHISRSRAADRRPWQIPGNLQVVTTMPANSSKQPRHQMTDRDPISHHHNSHSSTIAMTLLRDGDTFPAAILTNAAMAASSLHIRCISRLHFAAASGLAIERHEEQPAAEPLRILF